MEKYIKGSTGVYALIGSPVSHSGSPAMYNYCFREHGIDSVYVAFDIKEDQVEETIKAFRLLGIKGLNATMPCKTALAKCCDELSPAARIIGSCNTAVFEDGKLKGYATDGAGFIYNLKDNGVDIKDKNIVIFGTGGAAIAIYVECALQGASGITMFSRSKMRFQNASDTTELLKKEGVKTRLELDYFANEEAFKNSIKNADIIVNATSVGMKPNDDASIIEDTSLFRKDLVVCDIVYNPKETKMLKQAKENGVEKIIGGEGMLLWQGAVAYELYTGLKMPVEEYKKFKASEL